MSDATAAAAREIAETLLPGDVPLWVHPEWAERFPWLVQGTTGRGSGEEPFDLGLAGAQPVGKVLDRWRALVRATGMATATHSRQVHGTELWTHTERGAPGISIMAGYDGHLTERDGLLLTVGVADCVPVSIVDAERRKIAAVHSGWRGTAAGITERAIAEMARLWSSSPTSLWVHCGPAICGPCYEVGPEVHEAIHPDRPPPPGRANIDVRAAIAERVLALGVPAEQVTVSTHCTRCGPPDFFSHRGGSAGRQMGVLGVSGLR
ncbi:MAG: laccase domain-containing protein [Gemmatimonadetes bacterium]|nr:laccase domain-containing protein [Gemmatimonadota bacterium]